MMRECAVIAAFALLATATPLRAEDETFDFSKPADVARALRKAGYRGALKTAKSGVPYVDSATNGSDFSIYFYECDQLNLFCKSMDLYSYWKKQPYYDAALANRWNASMRFLRVAIDDDGDLEQRLDVSAVGLSYDAFVAAVKRYESTDADLKEFLNEEAKKAAPPEPTKKK